MSHNRFKEVANILEKQLLDGNFAVPSIQGVARLQKVSYVTAWKAFRELIFRGVLKQRGGRYLVSQGNSEVPEVNNAVQEFAAMVQTRIENGVYRTGQPLPKHEYFVRTEKRTRSTVLMGLKELEQKNVIHKAKNRWIAGNRLVDKRIPLPNTFHGERIVLICIANPLGWSEMCESHFSARFLEPFIDQMSEAGIRCVPVARNMFPDKNKFLIPIGKDEIVKYIEELAERYCGTLVWSIYPELEHLTEWIDLFLAYDKPVVYVDTVDAGEKVSLKCGNPLKPYYRLYINETGVLHTILKYCVAQGHKRIGVHNWQFTDWAERRVDALQRIALNVAGIHKLVLSKPAEQIWNINNYLFATEVIDQVAQVNDVKLTYKNGLALPDTGFLEKLKAETISFTELIESGNITLLICLNDRLMREYFSWCSAFGIRIPDTLSMISFDNMIGSAMIPVTTYDFGLARLGYIAAHAILQDMRIVSDKYGNVESPGFLVNRGSVARI